MTTGLWLVAAAILVWAVSGVPTAWRHHGALAERLATLLAVAGSSCGLAGVLLALAGDTGAATASWPVPGLSLAIELDGLSALFLVPVFVVPALAAVYGLGYAKALQPRGRLLRLFQGLLTAGMATLVVARNGVLFLVGWEVMALAAFLLIATEHHNKHTRRAAWVYIVTTHFGTLCLVAVMVLLQTPDGSLDWRPEAIAAMGRERQVVVWALAMIGFGLKAGLMPLHIWLPAAHGNAPSHVSAVLSGVLIKMGAYGLLRLLAMLPPLPVACGAIVLGLGAASALLGVAATFAQSDLKRLLAYSSIENVGIVFVGIGLFMLGRALDDGGLAVLGLAGALLHVLNHSLFKPLLFLGAGSVIHGAGSRDLDRLGGLWRRMPRTGAWFLVGTAAISGLPLLNGFASEFLLYLALFGAAMRADAVVALMATAALGVLAMVGGLAVATFVRCGAVVFLGRARSAAAAQAHESPASMTVPLAVLGTACLLLGLAPQVGAPLLDAAVATCLRGGAPGIATLAPFGMLSLLSAGCMAAAVAGLLWLWRRGRRRGEPGAAVGTWDCGFVDAGAPRLQYTGASFAQFAARVLGWAVREHRHAPASSGLFPRPHAFVRRALEPLLHGTMWAFAHRLADRCARLRILQRGKLQVYLLYILVVLVFLLAWSAFAS